MPTYIYENFPKSDSSNIEAIDIVLSKDKWSTNAPYTQTIQVNEIDVNNIGSLNLTNSFTQSQYDQLFYADITISGISKNSITVTANGDKPTIDLPLVLILAK